MSSPRLAAAASVVLVSGLLSACDPLGGTSAVDGGAAAGPGGSSPTTATPTVVAGAAAVTVASGGLVQLNVTGTSLKSAGSLVSCSWRQMPNGSPMVALSSTSSCTPSFMAPDVAQDSEFVFTVTGVDYNGSVGSDRITITVIASPIDFITFDANGFAFIGLGELGLSLNTVVGGVAEVNQINKNLDPNMPQVAIFNDRVHIVAPSDIGFDRDFEITLVDGDTTVTIPLHVPTWRPTLFAPIIGAPDGADPENQASDLDLITEGLVPEMGNVLGGQDLAFSVEWGGSPLPLMPMYSSGVVTLDDGTFVGDLGDIFTCNNPPPSCTMLWAPQADLDALLAGHSGSGVLTLSLVGNDFETATIHEASVLVDPNVEISGRLVDQGGSPLGHADLPFPAVLVKGQNSNIRRIVPVADDGTFEIVGLIRDAYEVYFADPRFFNQMTPVPVNALSGDGPFTTGDWVIPDSALNYDGPKLKEDAAVESLLYTSAVVSGGASQPRANEEQAGSAVSAKAATSDPATCNRQVGATTEFFAVAGGEGQVITCEIKNYTPPAGTDEVLMEVLIQSPEFPGYSPNPGNPYNDTWSYALNATSVGMLMESGEVNISHRTTGLIRRTYCLTGAAIKATGTMSVQNVGDSALATNVTVAFTPGCDVQRPLVELFVHRAIVGDMNTLSYSVSRSRQQRRTGDLGYNSLSVPFAPPSDTVGGVPFYVEYAPQDAVITGATVSIIDPTTGEVLSQSEDFIDQAGPGSNNGVLNFTDLELQFEEPAEPLPMYPLQAVVHLTGTVDGTPAGTFSNDPNVGFEGSDTMDFVPQTNVDYQGAAKVLMNRRYGIRNDGGDGWAAPWTIDWLNGNTFLFNDISPLHVAQREFESRVRRFRRRFFASILGSTGHSDGSQVDLRYLDADGMATDFDGNDIQDLIKTAKSGSTAGLAQWVTANRAALETAAMDARSIIVGAGELGQALFLGRVGGTDLGVGRWDSRPRIVRPSADHYDHWTIALEAPDALMN